MILVTEITNAELKKAAEQADTHPSDAQKESGNYKLGHVRLNGFDISIENPKGSKRYWKDENGKEGFNVMKHHYGYFKRTDGKDGDPIDVFIGPDLDFEKVYVVDQNKPDGAFDESKVMLGFKSKAEAKTAYLSNYEKGWKGLREITEVSIEDFKKWLYDGKKQCKPFSEYKSINETTSKNMKKNVIRLNEAQLRRVVAESVKRVINEWRELTASEKEWKDIERERDDEKHAQEMDGLTAKSKMAKKWFGEENDRLNEGLFDKVLGSSQAFAMWSQIAKRYNYQGVTVKGGVLQLICLDKNGDRYFWPLNYIPLPKSKMTGAFGTGTSGYAEKDIQTVSTQLQQYLERIKQRREREEAEETERAREEAEYQRRKAMSPEAMQKAREKRWAQDAATERQWRDQRRIYNPTGNVNDYRG